MEAKIRRERETLFLSSLAVILFGVWGSLKVVISYLLNPEEWIKLASESPEPAVTSAIVIALIIGFVLLDFFFRLSIGLPGIKESRVDGSGKRKIYLILAVLYLVSDVISFRSIFVPSMAAEDYIVFIASGEFIDHLATIIIEGTSCFAVVQLIVSSLKLKRLRGAAKAI